MLIYLITNHVNGKVYVGKTASSTFSGRWKEHCKALDDPTCTNVLYRAMRFHGITNFTIQVLEEGIHSKRELNERERFWIATKKSFPPELGFGYNMTPGGDGGVTYEWTDEMRAVQSARMTGSGNSMFGVIRESPNKGKRTSAAVRQHLSTVAKNRFNSLSEEERRETTLAMRTKLAEKRSVEGVALETRQVLANNKKEFWASKTPEERRAILAPAYAAPKNFTTESRRLCSEASKSGWTPERRAAQAERMRKRNLGLT